MIQIHQFLKENNCKSQMLMQVHDELVFNIKPEEFDFLKTNILHIMEYIIPSSIPLIVDV
jgi:DNA polymerase-1